MLISISYNPKGRIFRFTFVGKPFKFTSQSLSIFEIVKECEVNLNGFPMKVKMNILHLGSYDVLIDMDWLEQHHVMFDCLHKSILCTNI